MIELRATTDWRALTTAVNAIAKKASSGIAPESTADLMWTRLGNREITPLAIVQDGKRVGSLFYEIQRVPANPADNVLHIAGLHMDGSAAGWIPRVLHLLLPLARAHGCPERVHFSSPRAGWARAAGARAGFKNVSLSWLYEGGAHG